MAFVKDSNLDAVLTHQQLLRVTSHSYQLQADRQKETDKQVQTTDTYLHM